MSYKIVPETALSEYGNAASADLSALPPDHKRYFVQLPPNRARPIPQPPRYLLPPFPYAIPRWRIPSECAEKFPQDQL